MSQQNTILLVEDNPGDAILISEAITANEPAMFQISTQQRLTDALYYLSHSHADIVLLDLGLPDANGLDALRTIKAHHPNLPVVVITGNEDEQTGVKALKLGAQDYILKGMIPDHYLIQAIKYAIHRQESASRLKQSEEKYRNIVENIGIGVAVIDPAMNVLETNEKMEQWFPDFKSDAPLKCFNVIQAPCDGSPNEKNCPVVRTFADGRIHTGTNQCNQATYRTISSPLKNDGGKIKGVILLKEDISKQLAIESRLRQAQKMESLGTLAGGVAHDFNNILMAIQGFASLAREDISDHNRMLENITGILDASHRASDLVKQILTFSRMGECEKHPVRMDLIVKEALKLMRSSLPSNIEIRPPKNRITDTIVADPTQIHQILMNLCSNAGHAMEATGGTLEVSLDKAPSPPWDSTIATRGPCIKLTVRDTGCGIAPDIMDSIFDPYFTTRELGNGTGLGLSMVQGIVQDCGGDISVASAPGLGSTFTLFFPIAKDPGPKVKETSDHPPSSRGEHLLIIDDEPAILKIVGRLLERYGYQITTRANGLEAWEYLQSHPQSIDLILADMTMPKLTGLDLAKRVKDAAMDIPIILMSGYSQMLSPKACRECKIQTVLDKPLTNKHLIRAIRKTLDQCAP